MLEPTIEIVTKVETHLLVGDKQYMLQGNLIMDKEKLDAEGGGAKFSFATTKDIWDNLQTGDRLFFKLDTIAHTDGNETDA